MSKLLIAITAVVTVLSLGMFVYTSEALTYMGSEAETCANCHVMDDVYENWFHAPHERVTKCVDCHLPHDNPVSYWLEKGRTGVHDVYVFSTGQSPDVIRAKPESKKIIQENCVRCHESAVETMMQNQSQPFERYCWDCHRGVAHGPRGTTSISYNSSLYPVPPAGGH
jgi:cytochrome c nitrite reductase small subunit